VTLAEARAFIEQVRLNPSLALTNPQKMIQAIKIVSGNLR